MNESTTDYFTDLDSQRIAIEIQNIFKRNREDEIVRQAGSMSSAELGACYGEQLLDLLDLK